MAESKKSDVELAGSKIKHGVADSKINGGATDLTEHDLGQVSGGLVITGVQGESADDKHKGE